MKSNKMLRNKILNLIEKNIKINSKTNSMHRSAIKTLSKKYPEEMKIFMEITKECIPLTPTYRYRFLKKDFIKLPNCCNPKCKKDIGHFDKKTCLGKECDNSMS